jgi:hypothetical protein
MSVKANALVTDTAPGTTNGTMQVTMRSVGFDTGGVANITVDNLTPGISALTFEISLITAVKDYWNIGLLDTVRLIGSDIT